MFPGISIIVLTCFGLCLTFRLAGQRLRDAVVRSWVVLGLFVFVSTEALSLGQWFKPGAITSVWALLLLGLAGWLLRQRRRAAALLAGDRSAVAGHLRALYGSQRFVVLAVAAVLVLTLVHALLAPSFDLDSLSYHLPRATHWLANGSIRFYETAIARQNFQAPLYSFCLAHVMALTQSDLLLNLIQWVAFGVSAAVMSLIAGEMRISRRGQWLVAVLTLCIPQAVSQTIVCVNDLFAATAVMAFVLYLMRLLRSERIEWPLAALAAGALGVAFLAKYTALIHIAGFAVPIAVAALFRIWRRGALRQALKMAGVLMLVVVAGSALLAPQVVRNMRYYGDPLSGEPPDMLTNVNLTPKKLAVNYLRHLSMHTALPLYALNRPVERAVRRFAGDLIEDPDITYQNSLCFTDYRIFTPLGKFSANASNPLQFLFFALLLAALVVTRLKGGGAVLEYSVVPVLCGALLYGAVFKWQPWCVRLQIPYFMLMAPGIVLWLETRRGVLRAAPVLAYLSMGYALLHIALFSDWYMPGFLYGRPSAASGLSERTALAPKILYLHHRGWPADEIRQMRSSVPEVLAGGYSLFWTDRRRLYLGNLYHEESYYRYADSVQAMAYLQAQAGRQGRASNIGVLLSSDHGNMKPDRGFTGERPFAWEFLLWMMAENVTGQKPLKFEHFAEGEPQVLAASYFGDQEALILSDYSRESVLEKLKETRSVERVYSNSTFSVYSVGRSGF